MDPFDRLDPELIEPLRNLLEATGGGFDLSDIPGTRAMVDAVNAAVNAEAPAVPGVEVTDLTASHPESDTDVPVRVYRPSDTKQPLPALLWMHPGGFVIGSIEMDDQMARLLAKDVGCVIVSINYRLAPEHPYPEPLEDCYSVLQWLGTNAATLNIDIDRIAVGGASAGAGLAAGLTLLSRDRGGVSPMFQLLTYPALDDTNIEPASDTVEENLFWTRENARVAWNAYLNGAEATANVSEYAAPARATDLSGLPNAFIAVGTADMLMAENIAYAEKLAAAGAQVELKVYPGAFHAFDGFAPMSRLAAEHAADRRNALARAFG